MFQNTALLEVWPAIMCDDCIHSVLLGTTIELTLAKPFHHIWKLGVTFDSSFLFITLSLKKWNNSSIFSAATIIIQGSPDSVFKRTHSAQFSSVTQLCLTLWPHGLQHARLPCPSPTPGVYSNSCPLSRWCHPTISSSVVPFSSRFQSFPGSGSFQMSQLFVSGGQWIGVTASASALPMKI